MPAPLSGDVQDDSTLDQISAVETRLASSAAASTSSSNSNSNSKLNGAKRSRRVQKPPPASAAAAAEQILVAHTDMLLADNILSSTGGPQGEAVGAPAGDPAGGPAGVPQMDSVLQGYVDAIMARRCPNLNRFQNGSSYDVKVGIFAHVYHPE